VSLETKLLALLYATLFTVNMAVAQTDDPVLMKVNGVPVSRSEFVFWYKLDNESDNEFSVTPKEYLQRFIDYKLQVAEAYALKLDTISSLKENFTNRRDVWVSDCLVTDEEWEAEMLRIYNGTKENVGSRGLIRPAHILLYVRQDATNAELEKARNRADSLYVAIKNGADFGQLAQKYSQDETSARNGGVLPWIQPNQTWKEFEDAAYAMNVGEVSRPVQTPAGFHIIKMLEKKQLEPLDSLRDMLTEMMLQREIREQIISGKIDKIVKESKGALKPVAALDKLMDDTERQSPELKYEVQGYREDLLVMAASDRHLDSKRPYTTATLKAYFENNKKRYYYDWPYFRGIVIHAKTEQDMQRVKSSIKEASFGMWDDIIEKNFNNGPAKTIKYEKGIFPKGQDQYIDGKTGTVKNTCKRDDDFPFTDTYGKNHKKKDVIYEDVSNVVKADYEEELQAQWVESLRKKYPVEVFYDILKTVNKDNK